MSADALAYARDALLATIGIACAALALAITVGAPFALVIVRGGWLGRSLAAVLSVVRAIPELVLAIIAVVAVGFGPAAGVAALGLHYTAVIAKLYAEVLGGVRRDAAEALRATGATATSAFLVGMLPAAWPGIVGFGAYALESIMRGAVIVGVVGAGGIGALLMQQLNLADYPGFAISVALLVALVVLVDAVSSQLRNHASPALVGVVFLAVCALGVAAFVVSADPPWAAVRDAPRHLVAFARAALPPRLTPAIARTAALGIAVSVTVALIATVVGGLLALPLAWLATSAARARAGLVAASRFGRAAAGGGRILMAFVRAVPPIALALIGLSLVGLGPPAAIFALVLHTIGVLGKLLAESLELAPPQAAQALAASGARPAAATLVAIVPAAAPVMAAHVLYRFEWNVRASTVLGMVGAGGIGQAIFNEQQLLHYQTLTTYVIALVVCVLLIDWAVAGVRSSGSLRGLTR